MANGVKDLPAVQETQVWSLGRKDPLEEENGNSLQCSCLKKIPWIEEPESQTQLSD